MRENKYWLMSKVFHSSENWQFDKAEWTIYGSIEKNLAEGDIVYLINREIGIYTWGYLTEIFHSDLNDQSYIKISRGAIKSVLIEREQILQNKDLSTLLLFKGRRFTFLTNKQVKIINSLLPHGISKPPSPRKQQFILNQPVEESEDLYTEFKEINPNKIPDVS